MHESSSTFSSEFKTQNQFGYWSAILLFFISIISLVIGVLTPTRAGSMCAENCVKYPYTAVSNYFPRDYYWMVPAIIMVLLFIIIVSSLHISTRPDRKVISQIAYSFAIMSGIILIIDYFIQLTLIPQSLFAGEISGLSPFMMYNPHGLFVAMEDLGYLLMSLTFLFLAGICDTNKKVEKFLKWVFILNFILALVALIAFSIIYGQEIEYNLEITLIAINWITLIIMSPFAAQHFKS